MSYAVYIVNTDEDGEELRDYREALVIEIDGEKTYHYDGGEPEDFSFGRDLRWVAPALLQAYQQGLKDGKDA